MANGHGGKRRGAGRPGGTKNEKTLKKAEARELVRQMITENLKPMIKAQIANACGVQHFFSSSLDGAIQADYRSRRD
jgi:hypothetical protein